MKLDFYIVFLLLSLLFYFVGDIKPDNFLLGSKDPKLVYLIDVGLCKRYVDSQFKHIVYRENKKLTGTPRYASVNAHMGIEQSRRDDLESLGYMILYFITSKLPWQGIQANTKADKYALIGNLKKTINVSFLCHSAPKCLEQYLDYCKNLDFYECPNYRYLKGLFMECLMNLNLKNDSIFDWELISSGELSLEPEPEANSIAYLRTLEEQLMETRAKLAEAHEHNLKLARKIMKQNEEIHEANQIVKVDKTTSTEDSFQQPKIVVSAYKDGTEEKLAKARRSMNSNLIYFLI